MFQTAFFNVHDILVIMLIAVLTRLLFASLISQIEGRLTAQAA